MATRPTTIAIATPAFRSNLPPFVAARYSCLLLRNLRPLYDLRPALRLGGVEVLQLVRRAGAPFDAELGEAFLHLGRGERLYQRLVHFLDDGARRLRRRGKRVPGGD